MIIMKNYVQMGFYYVDKNHQLVRALCRAFTQTNEPMIAYVNVDKGGYASDVYLMNEDEFKSRFGI